MKDDSWIEREPKNSKEISDNSFEIEPVSRRSRKIANYSWIEDTIQISNNRTQVVPVKSWSETEKAKGF